MGERAVAVFFFVMTALRDAKPGDALGVTAFLRGLGLVMPYGDEAAIAHWRSLWETNPALKAHGSEVALGWVLEDAGRIVGFFGNIPQVSYFDGCPIRVSSARAWAVDKDYRSETPRLCEAFFNQSGSDVVLISSASPPAGRRCLEFVGAKMPQVDYEKILYWVIDASRFIRAGLRKKGQGAVAAWTGGVLGAVALNARMRLGGRRPFAPLQDISVVPIDEIGDDFDDLWSRKLMDYAGRLLACRNAETLRWYFGLSKNADQTRMLCCRRDGQLQGYTVLVREDAPAIGLKRIKIADMFVAGDDPTVIDALLAAAYEYGLATRCHVLEVIGMPETLRRQALTHKPFERPMATFPFFFKALNSDLTGPLSEPRGWYVTAFDGDTALL
jgi:hypothetical protein